MNPTLARLLTRLYPRRWRERYGAEFERTSKTAPTTSAPRSNVIWSAICEHIVPTRGGTMDQQSHSLRHPRKAAERLSSTGHVAHRPRTIVPHLRILAVHGISPSNRRRHRRPSLAATHGRTAASTAVLRDQVAAASSKTNALRTRTAGRSRTRIHCSRLLSQTVIPLSANGRPCPIPNDSRLGSKRRTRIFPYLPRI